MKADELLQKIKCEFFAGVPDSALRPVCDYLMEQEGISSRHIIAANEGNAAALAAGYYLATGKIPVVYLQNSGIGNVANPVISMMNEEVYGIPCLFLVGFRGEPGNPDEPQHRFQGKITKTLLEAIGIRTFLVTADTDRQELEDILKKADEVLGENRQVALVFSPKALESAVKKEYKNSNSLIREEAIRRIAAAAKDGVLVASTGKIARELFEVREQNHESHRQDFLTVGSMGHASSIAMGIATQKKKTRVWCLDGDGALLMHMGAMALIGTSGLSNMIHVVFNNGAHESVGGMPTVMDQVDLCGMAVSTGYRHCCRVSSTEELEAALSELKDDDGPIFLEVITAIGSRPDLGRPTVGTKENLKNFMEYLSERE